MTLGSCSSSKPQSLYASNTGGDGGYNPYPNGGGGYAQPGSLLPSGTHHQYAEAPPPPPPGYTMPEHSYSPPPVPKSGTTSSKPKSSGSSSTVKKSTPSTSRSTASTSTSKGKAKSKGPVKKSTSSGGSYTVVKGDSLYAIALRKHTTVAKLKSANGLSSDFLKIGQKLKIP